MRITMTGCRQTPSWETLQDALRQATGDERALLTRISRDDNGANYRAPGVYTLTLRVFDAERTVRYQVSAEDL